MKQKKVCYQILNRFRNFPETKFGTTEDDNPYVDITHFMNSHKEISWDSWLDFYEEKKKDTELICEKMEIPEDEIVLINSDNGNLCAIAPVGVHFFMNQLEEFHDFYMESMFEMFVHKIISTITDPNFPPDKIIKIAIPKNGKK